MEFFQRAKVFRLKCSHQSKYLTADQDEETVKLSRESSSPYARWSYELVEGKTNIFRLRSCHSWKFLAASEEQFLLGMTGKRVAQRPYLGSTVEWEPIKEGPYIKLKSHCGTFLRGNRGPPPWRNTITHDVPGHWTASESMILWIVDIVEIDRNSSNGGESGDPKSKAAVSLSSNVVDQKNFSSNSSLSIDDDGSAENVPSLEHSNSFSKLQSMLDSLDQIHEDAEREGTLNTEVLPSDIKMANRTLKELMDMDFHAVLTLDRYKKLENALNVLDSAAQTSQRETILSDSVNLHKQLKAMKDDHDSATHDLSGYAAFANLRLEIKAKIDKDVAKASVLEATLETWYNNMSVNGVEKEELEKQLEATESSIKAVEVLKTRIETENQKLVEMEAMETSWEATKVEAERILERVENEWVNVKSLLANIFLNWRDHLAPSQLKN